MSFTVSYLMYLDTCSHSSLLEGDTYPSTMCQEALRLSGWLIVARPAVRYGPVPLAPTPAHLPELTCSLPHHLSRRTKCTVVSWQSSLKCQPGVTNPCRPLGPHKAGSVGHCPGSDGEPGACHSNNNCWSTTGALPSCPGWIELVRSGRGWLFSLLVLNLSKRPYLTEGSWTEMRHHKQEMHLRDVFVSSARAILSHYKEIRIKQTVT